MSWIREHVERAKTSHKRSAKRKAASYIAMACTFALVCGVLVQGATALSGQLNAASMGIDAPTATSPAPTQASDEVATPNPDKGRLLQAAFSINRTEGGTQNLPSGSHVDASSRVQFELTFEFSGGTLSDSDHVVTYRLPDGIEVSASDGAGGAIEGEREQEGKALGTFKIENGQLIMTFSNAEVEDLYAKGLATKVSFWATAQNSSVTDSRTIDFGGAGTLVVDPTKPTIQVGKAVSKRQSPAGGDLADGDGNRNRHANYTITVGTTTGTGSTVNIDDTMARGTNVAAASYDQGSFSLKKYQSAEDTAGQDVAISDGSLAFTAVEGSAAHFALSGLPALAAGERYELSYSATVTETDHTADTSERNDVVASIDGKGVSQQGNATAQWGNKGDIQIAKVGKLLSEVVDPNDPKQKRLQYRLTVWTNAGTVTNIQIGDTANDAGSTNIDTSGWSAQVSGNLFFDHDSFHLTKYPTKADADAGTNGTNADEYLCNISFGADGRKPSLGLSLAEPLAAGEAYVLTYTATVTEVDENAPDTRMNNQAVARIYPGGEERKTDQANARIEWHNEIAKAGTFNQATGYIDWSITVNRNFGSAAGIAVNDGLPDGASLVSNVRVYTSDRSGGGKTLVRTIDLLGSEGNSVATDGYADDPSTYDPASRRLHVVLGSWATSKQPYTISFSTTAPADGTVSNRASEVVQGGGTYGTPGVGVGVRRQTDWGIAKAIGSTPDNNYDVANGTYAFAWNATATFPDQDLSSEGNVGVLRLHDEFGEVMQADGTSSSQFQGLHYAVARDLYAELTGASDSGAAVTLSLHNDADADGQARTYTLKDGVFTWTSGSQTVTLGGVELVPTFYDTSGATIENPAESDAHVKSFDLVLMRTDGGTINGRSLTVSNYHSILDARTLPPSTQVRAGNSLSSNRTTSATTQAQSVTTLSNPMEKQVRTLDNRGDNSDGAFSERGRFESGWQSTESGAYDSISGGQHAAQFRIALNTVSYPDNAVVTITDTLPAGMRLVTSTNSGNGGVSHPIRLVYGQNVGQGSASYTAKDTLSDSKTTGTYLSYASSIEGDRQVVTFTFDLSRAELPKGQYYITYTASFLDDTAWNDLGTTQRTYTNTARAQVGAVTYSDESTLTITREANPVQKSQRGALSNDRRGKYRVVINPAASDLVEGSDTVELLDTLEGWNAGGNADVMNPTLDPTSVHLYAYNPSDPDGIGIELAKSRYSLRYEYADGADGYRRMRVTVPDSTALVLVYDYVFNAGEKGDWGTEQGSDRVATVDNVATLAGRTSQRVSESVRHAGAGASGHLRALYIYKVDADNYVNTLVGATFDLYKAGAGDSGWTQVQAPDGGPITGGSLDANGEYQPYLDDLSGDRGVTEHDVIYKLVETQAPEGYGRTVKYFVWLDQNETEDHAWAAITGSSDANALAAALKYDASGNQLKGADGSDATVSRADVTFIPYQGGSLYVEDQYTSVTVTKAWSGTDGTPLADDDSRLPSSVKLQLQQAVTGSGEWSGYGGAITVTASDGWKHTWQNLPQADGSGNPYIYRVVEADASKDWRATYLNNDGISAGNITITNVRQFDLPSAGGIPMRWLVVAGLVVAGISAAGLAARSLARRA